MPKKHQSMKLGHFIPQIMQKANQPFYPSKANLTTTSLIDTLGFKASFIDQKPITKSTPKLNTKGLHQIEKEATTFYPQ